MKFCESESFDTLSPLPDSVAVCATVDEHGDEHVITELMIRRACEQMEATQMWQVSNPQRTGSMRPAVASPAQVDFNMASRKSSLNSATILAFERP